MAEVVGLDAGVADENVTVVCTKDGKEVKVRRRIANQIQILRGFLALNPGVEKISVNQIGSGEMQKMSQFFEWHDGKKNRPIKFPLVSKNIGDILDPFDAKFVDVKTSEDFDNLWELTLVANYATGLDSYLTTVCVVGVGMVFKSLPAKQVKELTRQGEPDLEKERQMREAHPEYFAFLKPAPGVETKED